jgi:peptidoglycan/xylan/chitin deacetylase (PgdA/CDA1 family)
MLNNKLTPFRLISPAGRGGRLNVFIFHRVLSRPDPLQPDEHDAVQFERIARFLAKYFNVLPLVEAVHCLESGKLPAAAASITFDDGYADNLTNAVPILKRHGLHATFFIATGFVDGGRMWNDTLVETVRHIPAGPVDWRRYGLDQYLIDDNDDSRLRTFREVRAKLKYLPLTVRTNVADSIAADSRLNAAHDLMMTKAEVIALRDSGMDVGAHSVTHPILAGLDAQSAEREIVESRDHLSTWLGATPLLFAYPNGIPGRDYTDRDVGLVRNAGFLAAVSTAKGFAKTGADLYQIPRFTPWGRSMTKFGLLCTMNLLD